MYSDGTGGEFKKSDPKIKARLVRLADVQPCEVEWLWAGRIAVGKVTLVVGNPGLGKSFVTLDIAARVSRGLPWADDPAVACTPASALLISCEDGLADTIVPRLARMEADLGRIGAIEVIEVTSVNGDKQELGVDLTSHIQQIEQQIEEMEDCKLVVIDPISGFLGEANENDNAAMRNIVTQLGKLAERRRVAIVLVSHLRKGEGTPISRVMGSTGIVAAVRAAWLVAKDPNNPERRLMLPLKNNLATDIGGLAYGIPSEGDQKGTVVWEPDRVFMSAEEALTPVPKKPGPAPVLREQAKQWLFNELKDGPLSVASLKERATEEGYSKATLRRAREELGVVSLKAGTNFECSLPAYVQAGSGAEPEQLDQVDASFDDPWEDAQDDQVAGHQKDDDDPW